MSEDRRALIERLIEAFNRRDIETILGSIAADADWPDAIDGGRIQGREAIRSYWTRQFQLIRVEITPLEYETLPDGGIAVHSMQLVRNLEGQVWSEAAVLHTFAFDTDGLIRRMDITNAL